MSQDFKDALIVAPFDGMGSKQCPDSISLLSCVGKVLAQVFLNSLNADDLYKCFLDFLKWIEHVGGLDQFTQGYKEFGINVREDGTIIGREWAPGAKEVYLRGDFNDWKEFTHPYKNVGFGKWELTIPSNSGAPAIPHLSIVKLLIVTHDGRRLDRLSPWAPYVVCINENKIYDQVMYNPPEVKHL
ncbi:1,4-alpha-glucan branching enzyme [Paragonimus westermani]|uniref:1,4-alpha-glucan branching enzyme n=1 Tax=Paragonimus westermani TaxID=34504 RepID=A0A5J4NQE5_9TREM|nr:1,4-alpha-glucan branching enzyme [Paragonimus westermani]